VEGLEAQERSGFDDIHRLLKGLPVPVTKAIRVMTVYVPSIYRYIRRIWRYILVIYLDIPIIRKSLSEQWFIKFRLRKTMQCVWDVPPIRSKHPRLPKR
jgi:hypothetical protein